MDQGKIIVACIKNVLDPLAEGAREVRCLPAGHSVAEYVSEFLPSLDRDLYDLSIAINGDLLEGDDRVTRIVPAGSSLVFCATPRGDGKNPLAILGMLAVIVFAWYVSPYLVAAMGYTGQAATMATGIVAGGIIGVGGMVINAVFPPNFPDLGGMENFNESPTYSWDLRGNNLVEGGPIPILYGTHRVTPPIISRFLETAADKQYMNILFGVADCLLNTMDSVRIQEQSVANYKGIIVETRKGENNQPVVQFFDDTITGTSVQTKIVDTNWVTKTTTGNAVEGLGVVIVLPKGLFYANDSGGLSEQSIKLMIEYKKQGESVWTRAKEAVENEIQVGVDRWSAGYWGPDGSESWEWIEMIAGSTNPGDHNEGDPCDPPDWWYYGDECRPVYEWRWVQNAEYVTERKTVLNNYYTITGQQTSAIRRSIWIDNIPDGAGTYDVRVAFETTPPSGSRYGNETWWESIQEVVYDDFTYPNTALLGIRALATDQLQGSMPRIDVLATRSTVPVWTGSQYENKSASNPAWACYDLLHRGGDGVPYGQIDFNGFDAWATWAASKSYTCNIYFDSIMSLREALNVVSVLGRGSVVQIGSKFTAIYDNDNALPTQKFLFSVGNILRDSFSVEYLSLDDRANAIEVTYFDSNFDYTRQTVELYADDFDTTTEEIQKSQITLYGCTDRNMAIKHGKFLLNCNRYITQTATWEADVDAIVCLPGDVVEVQHDVTQWGIGGRAVAATSTSITLDREVTIEGGKTYHVTIKHQDDDAREERTVTNGAGTYTTLNISSAWTKTPAKYAIYSFGEVNALTKQFRVIRIEATADQRRRITGVEYNAAVYSDSATVPAPSPPGGIPVPTNLVANENWQGGKVSSVTLTWQGYAPKWNIFVHAPNMPFKIVGSTPHNKFDVIGLDFGVNLTFAVSSTEFPFDGEEVSLTLVGPGTGMTTPTFDAGSCTFTDRVKLRWIPLTDEHLAGYELRTDLNWGNDANLIFKGMATYFEMEGGQSSYTFYLKAYSIYGGYSASYDQVTVTNTAPAVPVVTVRYGERDILLTWTPPTELDYKETRVQVFQEAGRTTMLRNELATGNNYLYTFEMNRADYPSPGPNWNVYFRVIHYDKFGSNSQTDPTANNTSPGLPTGGSATGSFKAIVIQWTNPSDIDLDVIEVYRSSSNDSSTATKIGEIRGIVYIDSGLGNEETWYYWLKSRDTSGNLSGFCHGQYSGHSATTLKVQQTDLADTLTFIDVVGALPGSGMSEGDVVYLTTDDKLYRYDGSQWIVDVAAGDITGQITTTQIGDNQITTPKINALAVNAGHIAADAIESDKIKANAVIAGKIAAGAVGADEISANAISAGHIDVGSITAKHLTLMDSENLCNNPIMEVNRAGSLDGWLGFTAAVATSGLSDPTNAPCDFCASQSQRDVVFAPDGTNEGGWFAVEPGDEFYCEAYVLENSTKPYRIGLQITDLDTTNFQWLVADNITNATVWTKIGGSITIPSTFLSGYVPKYARIWVSINAFDTFGTWWITKILYRKKSASNLIVDGAIITDKLAANAVTAGKIGADEILAKHIKITDTTNIVRNGEFAGGSDDGWLLNTSDGVNTKKYNASGVPAGAPSEYVVEMPVVATIYNFAQQTLARIPVAPGDIIFGSGWLASDSSVNAAARGSMKARFTDRDDANPVYVSFFDKYGPSIAWSNNLASIEVPAGKYFLFVYLETYHASTTGGNFYLTNINVRRTNSADLIVDGAIKTSKIYSGLYTPPGDDNSTPGAGMKLDVDNGKIEAYGNSHALGGNLVASDGNYMVSVGRYLTATGKTKKYPLHNATNFTEDGRTHFYDWISNAWVERASMGKSNYGTGYASLFAEIPTASERGIYALSDGKSSAIPIQGMIINVTAGNNYAVIGASHGSGGTRIGGYFDGDTSPIYLAPSGSASAPTHAAPLGSLWVTSGGVLYINTSGGTTWQKVGAQ